MTTSSAPYWRLSGFYLFYFAAIGVLVPYWPLYLESLGFGPREIGELMAVVMATKIIAPNIWGWIADHTGRRMIIVRSGSLLACIFFAGIFWSSSYLWVALVMAVFSFFWNATLPQFEATTFNYLHEETHRYGSIRLWGSIGFIVAALYIGYLLESSPASIVPIAMLIMFILIWLTSLVVPERSARHLPLDEQSFITVMKRPEVAGLIVVVFLMQLSHGPYYTFYSIYLQDYGYSKTIIGGLWALGVVAEVGVFLFMHRLIPKFGLRLMLMLSLFIASVRWLLLGSFVESFPMLILIQLGHAATFGIFHAVSIEYIHHYFRGRHQGRGQALYSSMSFGAGGALGALMSGYLWETGAMTTFVIASITSTLALLLTLLFVRNPKN